MIYGYLCMYKGKKLEIRGEELTKFQAQEMAAKEFKAKKAYQVDVYLCEKICGDSIETCIQHLD